MLVSRPLIMQCQVPSSDSEQNSISFPRLFQQGKLISQIIEAGKRGVNLKLDFKVGTLQLRKGEFVWKAYQDDY